MPTFTLIHAIPTDSKYPSAVHFNSGKSVKFWKNAFKTLYIDKYGLKRGDFTVKEVCKTYKKTNAIMQAHTYAAEHDCLVFTKEHRKPAVWKQVAQVKKTKGKEKFEYQHLCSDFKFEPVFLPFCRKLVNATKQSEAIPIFANFLVQSRIPVPRHKDRRKAFMKMFGLPRKAGKEPECAFDHTRSICSTVLLCEMESAPHKYTHNGSRLPNWSEELDKEFAKEGDMIFSITDFSEIWRKNAFINKICAEMNKLYNDQKGQDELELAKAAVQVV